MKGTIRSIVAVAILAGSVFAAVVTTDERPTYRSTASVCIDLKVQDHLSGPASRTMREEATRIWSRHRVTLSWTTRAQCDETVPIVFDADRLRAIAGTKRENALALTVFSGRSRVVYVSTSRAYQLVLQLHDMVAEGERDIRGGMLLGRVVAHELGHVLLGATSHTDSGLMRPMFGAEDVLSGDDRTTLLSSVQESRIATRFSLTPLDPPTVLAQGR